MYYTPQQVVGCQTALVAELLDLALNKPMSFADDGLVMLDSSAGTSAYPLAAIEFALRKAEENLGPGAVAEYATRCAQNIYAFEVQVGPYAVSHLRLTKLLSDAGATLPPGGLNVYLTDTLESPHVDPPQPPLMAERLTQEQRRARRVNSGAGRCGRCSSNLVPRGAASSASSRRPATCADRASWAALNQQLAGGRAPSAHRALRMAQPGPGPADPGQPAGRAAAPAAVGNSQRASAIHHQPAHRRTFCRPRRNGERLRA